MQFPSELYNESPLGGTTRGILEGYPGQVLSIVLHRCQEKNLSLNWEKCHFMVTEGIVLRHRISAAGLEVDQEKVSIIKTLMPPPTI